MIQTPINGKFLTCEMIRAQSPIVIPECWVPDGFRGHRVMKECTNCPFRNTNSYFIKKYKNTMD